MLHRSVAMITPRLCLTQFEGLLSGQLNSFAGFPGCSFSLFLIFFNLLTQRTFFTIEPFTMIGQKNVEQIRFWQNNIGFCTRSSAGQSAALRRQRSRVRISSGAPFLNIGFDPWTVWGAPSGISLHLILVVPDQQSSNNKYLDHEPMESQKLSIISSL